MKNISSTIIIGSILLCNFAFSSLNQQKKQDYLPEDNEHYETGKENISTFNEKYQLKYNQFREFKARSLYGKKGQKTPFKYVITIDDGPAQFTKEIIQLLKQHSIWHRNKFGTNIQATFFQIGEKIERRPELSLSVINHGHTLSGHTWSHPYGNKISSHKFRSELIKSHELIDRLYQMDSTFPYLGAIGIDSTIVTQELENDEIELHNNPEIKYFRFPYADYGKPKTALKYHHFNELRDVSYHLYGANCIHFAFWDVDPGDWMSQITPSQIFKNFLAKHRGGQYWERWYPGRKPVIKTISTDQATFGGVLLMHETQKKSVEFLEMLLNYAKDNNIQFVPLEDVEEYNYGQRCY